jgi:hypothetical protein
MREHRGQVASGLERTLLSDVTIALTVEGLTGDIV